MEEYLFEPLLSKLCSSNQREQKGNEQNGDPDKRNQTF